MKHGHYKKDVSHLSFIDPYRIAGLYGLSGPLEHAHKKILCSGIRGAKSQAQDVQEAIDSLVRWQEMQIEDASGKDIGDLEHQNQWPADDSRIDVIGQNGNDGEHYREKCICAQYDLVGSCSVCGKRC